MSSELKTNKISPATGTALQIADSGDTITIPSGATITNSGTATGFGKVLQVVSATKQDAFTTASTSYTDLTGLSVSITPTSTSNKVLVIMSIGFAQTQPVGFPNFTIDRNGTDILNGTSGGSTNGLATVYGAEDGSSRSIGGSVCSSVLDSPSSTSALTYKVQCKTSAQTLYVNRYSGNTSHGLASTIIAMEIGA